MTARNGETDGNDYILQSKDDYIEIAFKLEYEHKRRVSSLSYTDYKIISLSFPFQITNGEYFGGDWHSTHHHARSLENIR